MHNIIRDGVVESQFASENYGSRHDCANEQVQAKKKPSCDTDAVFFAIIQHIIASGSLNELIDCVITTNDPHYFEFSQLFDKTNFSEFSEMDCISD
jgi:hypothetical protein